MRVSDDEDEAELEPTKVGPHSATGTLREDVDDRLVPPSKQSGIRERVSNARPQTDPYATIPDLSGDDDQEGTSAETLVFNAALRTGANDLEAEPEADGLAALVSVYDERVKQQASLSPPSSPPSEPGDALARSVPQVLGRPSIAFLGGIWLGGIWQEHAQPLIKRFGRSAECFVERLDERWSRLEPGSVALIALVVLTAVMSSLLTLLVVR